jgi:hypothetical protein
LITGWRARVHPPDEAAAEVRPWDGDSKAVGNVAELLTLPLVSAVKAA